LDRSVVLSLLMSLIGLLSSVFSRWTPFAGRFCFFTCSRREPFGLVLMGQLPFLLHKPTVWKHWKSSEHWS